MDLTNIINSARAAVLANNIRSTRYEDLTPDQRRQIETSLTYFDYFQGYDETDTDAQKAQKFNDAVQAFTTDNKFDKLSPFQQFLAMIFSFLEANGVNLNQTFGALRNIPGVGAAVGDTIDTVSANDPSRNWDRYTGPRAGQSVDLPLATQIEHGALGATLSVPQPASAEHQGRYRLVTVATDSQGNNTRAEMVVLNPQGQVVWRSMMNSGSGGAHSLPGLRTARDGQPVTTEYHLDWNDVRLNRRDRLGLTGMSMSDGSPGFSFTLENPTNIAELGGAGRNGFRIHPGGRNVGTAGCLEFLGQDGQIGAESDRNARSFAALMTSLPPDQRPTSLEILNPKMLGQHVEFAQARPQTATVPGANSTVRAAAAASAPHATRVNAQQPPAHESTLMAMVHGVSAQLHRLHIPLPSFV